MARPLPLYLSTSDPAVLARTAALLARVGPVSVVRAAEPGGSAVLVGTLDRATAASRGLIVVAAGDPGCGAHADPLTSREKQVLRLVADGHDTAEIAHALAYSERSIKNVIQHVTARLHLRNRCHAVAVAIRQGWI
jgi:DNA-binding NarL/FixJ family response regulator